MGRSVAERRVVRPQTVLVVEDDDRVRAVMRTIFEAHGFAVLVARHGAEALALIQGRSGPLHLLVADVVMPELGGHALAERLAAAHPETKILFISGHPDDVLRAHGVLEGGRALLRKPFTPSELLARAQDLLEGA
jgi:two-component system cell cycle sensor histidine kinase/response regulator CckA